MPPFNPRNARGRSPIHLRSEIARISGTSERRRYAISDSQNVQATNHVVNGTSLIVGVGEALITVAFPVAYIRTPSFSFGSELSAESVAIEGKFPTLSAIVNQWAIEDPDRELFGASMRKYYRGATLACVVTGPGTQKLLLHWTFTGMALTNPGGGTFQIPSTNSSGRVLG